MFAQYLRRERKRERDTFLFLGHRRYVSIYISTADLKYVYTDDGVVSSNGILN